ncbi:MAG TPA: PIG-L family deacetylase [Kiritimatiellia bacterium]|nr:PIG-L family deacetylase [Kiritimatiellia bacterium]
MKMEHVRKPIQLLAIGAHPDDIEFGMGGVLLKERDAGAELSLVITSKGESGTSGTPALREAEARAAASMLGAADRMTFLDFGGDGQQEATPGNALALARIIRDIRPSMVFAPVPLPNQHPDHVAVGTIARNACRLARFGGLAPLKPLPLHKIDSLWFYSLSSSSDAAISSAVLVDISNVMEEWKTLMACHHTQVTSRDYLDLQISRARQLGLMAGCEYASALWPGDPPVVEHISDFNRTARGF